MFQEIFNQSQVKIELENIVHNFIQSNEEYKFYNIEIGLYYTNSSWSTIKANLKNYDDSIIGDFNRLTFELATKNNLVFDIKQLISNNNLTSLPEYLVLIKCKSEKSI